MIETFLAQASTYAKDIDNLFTLIAVLVGFWLLVAEGIFFYFIFRFRARDGQKAEYITGEEKHQKRWINIPHVLVLLCDVAIIIAAVRVWVDVKQTLPPAEETIRVIGQQWAWTFMLPGADGKLDTPDDIVTVDELHIEVGRSYQFELQAKDVLHSFSVPVFRLKQDAIPGRTILGWFKPILTGVYDIQCAEICGIGHGIMGARVHIEDAEQHALWLSSHQPVQYAAAQP